MRKRTRELTQLARALGLKQIAVTVAGKHSRIVGLNCDGVLVTAFTSSTPRSSGLKKTRKDLSAAIQGQGGKKRSSP